MLRVTVYVRLAPDDGGGVNGQAQLYIGPGKIKQIHGFNGVGTSAAILFLQIFDWIGADAAAIPPNSQPLFAIPVPGGFTPYSWDCISSSRSFQYGLAYGISSTPMVYTPATAFPGLGLSGPFEVVTELYAGGMQTLSAQPNS